MDIVYLGHSSFKISGKKATVMIDPYEDSIGIKFPETSADIVTVSHDHSDHNNTKKVTNTKKIFSNPGEYELEGVSLIGIPSFHDDSQGSQRGKNTIFIIEIDGFRIAHLGDLGHKLNEKQISLLGDIDILMIPVGGIYTIGPEVALDVARAIDPKIIIPMHFNDPALNQEMFGKLEKVDVFANAIGGDTQKSTKLSIKEGSIIPDEQSLHILSRK